MWIIVVKLIYHENVAIERQARSSIRTMKKIVNTSVLHFLVHCTVDELCSEGDSVKKIKKIAPQLGFELTPLEERSFQVKSSTTELQRHLKEQGKI